jgi:hypothetical protein
VNPNFCGAPRTCKYQGKYKRRIGRGTKDRSTGLNEVFEFADIGTTRGVDAVQHRPKWNKHEQAARSPHGAKRNVG